MLDMMFVVCHQFHCGHRQVLLLLLLLLLLNESHTFLLSRLRTKAFWALSVLTRAAIKPPRSAILGLSHLSSILANVPCDLPKRKTQILTLPLLQ